jgi:DNA-binding SARP family transcriptional activator
MIEVHLSGIDHVAKQHQIPVIYIIPETNLKDWKYINNSNYVLMRQEQENAWTDLKKHIENCIEKQAYTMAEDSLHTLIAMDKTNPYGYEMLANLYEKMGEIEKAMRSYEQLRDLCLFTTNPPPLITTFIRKKLKEYK